MKPINVLAALLVVLPSATAWAVPVTVVSNPTDWVTVDSTGQPLCPATGPCIQKICLDENSPPGCPPDAVKYGYGLPAWRADLSGIPGAWWIWGAGTTSTTVGAQGKEFRFERWFWLCSAPVGDGTIWFAADNEADVLINNQPILVNGANAAHTTISSSLLQVTVPNAMLGEGLNVIDVTVTNGMDPDDCSRDTYGCNPAGVVFGGLFKDALKRWPTCPGHLDGKPHDFEIGESEHFPCMGQNEVGSIDRECGCWHGGYRWGEFHNNCHELKLCSDQSGFHEVGFEQTIPCPADRPLGAGTHKCVADKTWNDDFSNCKAVPVTCTSKTGATFTIGQSETLACIDPRTGSAFHTCKPDGTWSDRDDTGCHLPKGKCGDICGSPDAPGDHYLAECPTGENCASRKTWIRDWLDTKWTPATQTRDWYCCDWNYQLGARCNFPQQCLSGYCDLGAGTSKTGICVPRYGTGQVGDPCSDDRHCAGGRCDARQDVGGGWHPGLCRSGKGALGDYCIAHPDCASGYCDRGDGTSKTSRCMPNGPTGRTGDWCSHHNQCVNRTCVGLQAFNQEWRPGHCN